ncbi:MAG: hydrogenase maturation protease, partial [Deltaproteobacteria bacterium]
GIGSPHGDDRAGWIVGDEFAKYTARMQTADVAEVEVCKVATPLDLLDRLEGIERLIVCDAVCGAGAPGTLHRWQWPDPRIAQVRPAGSHDFGLAAALELAASLGRLPAEVIVWGIEGGQAVPAGNLAAAVGNALPELIERIQVELGLCGCKKSNRGDFHVRNL